MNRITRPAAQIHQGGLKLYATSLTVEHLGIENFYSIDTLDPNDKADTGYQRFVEEIRAKRLADYLIDGQREGDAFLPTSIFLATNKTIEFDPEKSVLSFEIDRIGPFNVVDGQHRIRGLLLAAEHEPSFKKFEFPVVIAVGLDVVSQMCHFLIVNTTQRSIDKAIAQQIIARLTKMIELEKIPTIPRWIRRQVEKGDDARALSIAEYLNAEISSPWKKKIKMANTLESPDFTVTQKSFVESLKKYVLTPSNPIMGQGWELDKQKKCLLNYWQAVAETISIPEEEINETVLFKTTGANFFHMLSTTIFIHLASKRDYSVRSIENLLKRGFANLPSEDLKIGTPEYWTTGGEASGLNQGAVRKLASSMSQAINAIGSLGGIHF